MNVRYISLNGTEDGLSAHQEVRDRLLAIIAQQPLGAPDEHLPAAVEIHLSQCEPCSEWWAELKELAELAYGDELPVAPAYPTPDLSFLPQPSPSPKLPSMLRNPLGQFVVSFPSSFLATLQQPAVAGALRGQYVFTQSFKLEQAPGVVVKVEVSGRNTDTAASLCVECDVLNRDPLAQAGSRVIVRTGGSEWQGVTDDTGSVRFDGVPLAMLPNAQIEIEPDVPP